MSYGYGYGYGYGEETTTPDYEEDYGAEMEEDDSSSSPLGMAFILVPLLDGAAWYVTNDKWAATVSQWTDAKNSMLGSAVVCGLAAVGNLAAPDAVEAFFPILAGLGGVWNLANLYLIKRGEDASASNTNSTKIAYGLSVWRPVAESPDEVMSKGLPFLRNKAAQYGLATGTGGGG